MVSSGYGNSARPPHWWQIQNLRFGDLPFDDIAVDNPLVGKPVSSVPENELMHAATLSLLPQLERLWIYGIEHESSLPSLARYAASCRRRVARVLLQHLRVQRICEKSNDYNDADEAVDLTTLAFIHMVGAFDVLALFTRDSLVLNTADRQVAWQNDTFRADIKRVNPALASLFAAKSRGGRTFDAIRALRNTVHKAMPDPALSAKRSEDNWNTATIVLEGPAHAVTVAALDDAGWSQFIFDEDIHPESLRDSANVELSGVTRAGDMLFLEPMYLLRMCLNEGIPLINKVMAAIPVERSRVPPPGLAPSESLYPTSLRAYALDVLGLTYLANALRSDA